MNLTGEGTWLRSPKRLIKSEKLCICWFVLKAGSRLAGAVVSSWVTGEKRSSRASIRGQRRRAQPALEQEAGQWLWLGEPCSREDPSWWGGPSLEVAARRAAFVTLGAHQALRL